MKIKIILIAVMATILSGCGIEQVDEGYRGIKTEWGKMVGEPLQPGLYFYKPWSEAIFEMDVKEHSFAGKETAYTKDTQQVQIGFTVTAYPDPAHIHHIYSQFGKDWQEKILFPAVKGNLKNSVGQYAADDLVSKRAAAEASALKGMQDAMLENKRPVFVTRIDFTNMDFNDEYEKAVEAKVVAIQRANEAINKTRQVNEEARQTIAKAEAEAKAMRIKTEALAQNKSLIDYEYAQAFREKWDGSVPQMIMGGSSGMIFDMKNIIGGGAKKE